MGYPTYADYRDSGITWLGNIPHHWQTRRLRFLLSENFSNGLFKKSHFWGNGSPIVNVSDAYAPNDVIIQEQLDRVECDSTELKKYQVKHGDFFVVRSSLKLEGIGKSSVILEPTENTVFECHLIRGRPSPSIHPRFLNLLLNSKYAIAHFISQANVVTMATIDQIKLKDIKLAIPQLEEQTTIAAFLDHKTQQIDKLINKKQTLIDKLNEQRIALITHAVTKGLNADVELQDSGIEWLGEVPKHWDVIRLRFLLAENFANGLFKKTQYWGTGTPIINVSDAYVPNDIVNQDALDRVECSPTELKKYQVKHGDFFVVRSSLKLGGIGKSSVVLKPTENTVFECHLIRGRPEKSVHPRFLNLLLNSRYAIEHFISQANIVTMATIDQIKLKDIPLPVPLMGEQREIVAHLDTETTRIDRMIDLNQQTITKLKEYRTALIAAAVTGKIDVRDWQPDLKMR